MENIMEESYPFIITISRQIGSGGSYIGRELSKRLNMFYDDREIIREAAKELSVHEEDIESIDEKVSGWDLFLKSFVAAPDLCLPSKFNVTTDAELFKTESEIIERLAKDRSSVIVGRSSSFVLRNHPNHISLFLHGDLDFRIQKIKETNKIDDEEARKIISQTDKARALYFKTFTKQEWCDARLYDLSINTTKLGYDKSVELILNYIEIRNSIKGKNE